MNERTYDIEEKKRIREKRKGEEEKRRRREEEKREVQTPYQKDENQSRVTEQKLGIGQATSQARSCHYSSLGFCCVSF